jgi:uncharacterized membrane protein
MDDARVRAALDGQTPTRIGDWFSRGTEVWRANWGPYLLFTLLYAAITGLGQGLLNLIIGMHLIAGFFVVALRQLRGQPTTFGDFWKAFEHFVPFLLASLLTTVLIALGTMLCILPGVYLAVAYLLVPPILWDRRLEFWEAMELSRQVITARWFAWFGLALLLILLNLAGALACGVGLLVTWPLSICILAAAYEDVLGAPA